MIAQTVICVGDEGENLGSYSRILGSITASNPNFDTNDLG